jgi:hypothetical protein
MPRRKRKLPRQYSLVRFRFDLVPAEYHSRYPFKPDRTYVFFGDIPNMPGHGVVADHRTGKIFSGYHTENFSELTESEM